MPKNLVIVESPAKAKTIKRYLGKEFVVEASMGHVRDLPENKLGVDTEQNFTPTYIIPEDKRSVIKRLKEALRNAKQLWIATDEDREGEAIGWHLIHALGIRKGEFDRVKRIVFHEITEEAIRHAIAHPRRLDQRLIDSQQARRVLDRLVGYTLSPFLWTKVYRGLSAGRVQSVAVRLIVDREREIEAFRPEEYWSITASLATEAEETFNAELRQKGRKKFLPKNEKQTQKVLEDLEGASYRVATIEKTKVHRNPSPPFTTSTLQQEASNKLGFSVKQTMLVAQQLYEGVNLGKGQGQVGLITYMRTDSVHLSRKALEDAPTVIEKLFGREYILSKPRTFRTKSKGAQEAHEAIRPTELHRTPESLKDALDPQQLKLYTLIWKRTVATQMPAAELLRVGVDISAGSYLFRATGQTMEFDGFLRLNHRGGEDEGADAGEKFLPQLTEEQSLRCLELTPEQHFTKPPPRYTEATLVKKLEEEGIGRPSTYAPTISTIQQRGYIRKEDRQLIPEQVASLVTDLLTEHFQDIVDLKFTARMEQALDDIACGKITWIPFLHSFYGPFHTLLERKSDEVRKEDVIQDRTEERCPLCRAPMVVKLSRYGKFLACSSYPRCKGKKLLPEEEARRAKQEEERREIEQKLQLPPCPECGAPLTVKRGRYGMFIGCSGYPSCRHIQKLAMPSGISCPTCGSGEIVEKRTRRGKRFWGCNRYPACSYATWVNPVKNAGAEPCEGTIPEKR